VYVPELMQVFEHAVKVYGESGGGAGVGGEGGGTGYGGFCASEYVSGPYCTYLTGQSDKSVA